MNTASTEFSVSCLEIKELPINGFITLSVYKVKHSEIIPASLSVDYYDLSQLKLSQLLKALLVGRMSKYRKNCDAVNIDGKYLNAFVKLKKINLRTLLLFHKPSKLKEIHLLNVFNINQNSVSDEAQDVSLTSPTKEEGLSVFHNKLSVVKTIANDQNDLIVYDTTVKMMDNGYNGLVALKIVTEDGSRILLSEELRKYVEKASVKPYLTRKKRRVKKRKEKRGKKLKNVKKSK